MTESQQSWALSFPKTHGALNYKDNRNASSQHLWEWDSPSEIHDYWFYSFPAKLSVHFSAVESYLCNSKGKTSHFLFKHLAGWLSSSELLFAFPRSQSLHLTHLKLEVPIFTKAFSAVNSDYLASPWHSRHTLDCGDWFIPPLPLRTLMFLYKYLYNVAYPTQICEICSCTRLGHLCSWASMEHSMKC